MPAPRTAVLTAEAVLFDMDGTLVDSTMVVEGLWAEFAARYGLSIAEILSYSHGRQTQDTIERFLPPGEPLDDIVAAFQSAELTRTDGISEIPGAGALLRTLARAKTAIVTSAPRALAGARLRAAGIAVPEVLVAAEDVPAGKPDPAGYLSAADALGTAPSRCLAFEDAEAGILAATSAGVPTVVVGDHRAESTQDLHRISDFTHVHAEVGHDDSLVRLQWRESAG